MRLSRRGPVDGDPSAADGGNAMPGIMAAWVQEDGGRDPAVLIARAEKMIGDWTEHPLLRVLWQPRVLRAVQWAAEQLGSDMADGWLPVAVEARGERTLAGVALNGRADRIDAREDRKSTRLNSSH